MLYYTTSLNDVLAKLSYFLDKILLASQAIKSGTHIKVYKHPASILPILYLNGNLNPIKNPVAIYT